MLDLSAYFQRIGYTGSRAPTLETLRAMHLRHALTIPFENFDVLLGVPIALDQPSLERKLVGARRGGYCFEQNLLFGRMLSALGFDVQRLAARVLWQRSDDGSLARTHMLLNVQLGEGSYLCDVGFGGLTLTGPVRLEPDVEQTTPHETFRVRRESRELTLEARVRGEWRPLYRFDSQTQREADIEVLSHYVSTHAASPFRSRIMAALVGDDCRYALRDGQFTIYHRDESEERTPVDSVTRLRAVLEKPFGISLPAGEGVDAALARVLGTG
jgi:N-hydroxyarylamine O-acetyltransferase